MNLEQIKDQFSMTDIIRKCGLEVHKGGFCKCPFHKNDDTPSLKIYDKSYHCFACGKNGDIINFVMAYCGLDFIDACEWISGEELTRSTKRHIAVAGIRRKDQTADQRRLLRELNKTNKALSGLWRKYQSSIPFSDEWTEAYNKWQLLCYRQETIFNELREQ